MSVAALLSLAVFFQQFNFGEGELKFVVDFGFGAMTFLGSILSIFATAQLYFSELDQRTTLAYLRDLYRVASFILGKALGASIVVWAFMALPVLRFWLSCLSLVSARSCCG